MSGSKDSQNLVVNMLRASTSLCIRQTVLPSYRADFFDLVAERWDGRVTVFAGQPPPSEAVATVQTLKVAELITIENIYLGSGLFQLIRQPRICRLIQAANPEIVVTNSNARLVDTPALARFTRRVKIPLIGWGLGTTNFFGHPLVGIRTAIKRRAFRKFDGLIAYGSQSARQLTEELRFPKERIRTVFNATRRAPTSEVIPAKVGGEFRVLSIGRLIASKRFDLLIDAMGKVKERCAQRTKLVFVGDGPERESLESLAKQNAVDVEFMGFRSGEDLEQIGRGCHVFVLPSLGGLAIQEAMSFGLAVIVSQADGTEEDLVRPENGWIIAPNDVGALADAIEQAVSDPLGCQAKGHESLRIAREEINLEKAADAFVAAARFFIASNLDSSSTRS